MTPTVGLVLLGVTLALLVVGLLVFDRGQQQRTIATRRSRPSLRSDPVPRWRRGLHAAVVRTPPGRSVDERLRAAGREEVLAGDLVAAALAAAVVVGALASRVVTLPAAVVVAAVLLAAGNAQLDRLVRDRAERFADQLPDMARVMSNAAGAGMAIPNALALTARELEEPAATLLGHAVRQMAVGQSLAGAMEELKGRVPSREMAVLVSTLVIQQRSGGDVIEALREMSHNLEVRRDLKREVRTVMSGVKFTAYAIMGLGVATLLMLEGIASGTLRTMTERTSGQIVLLVSFTFYALGYSAVRRLARVDV
ncbi:type II secretion system F family protein [soil metagenome]